MEEANQRSHLLHSTLNNPAALNHLRASDSKVNDRLEATQPQILTKSKYSSTRQQQESLSSQGQGGGRHLITGKRVVQPRLVVQPDVQENSERISNRWSPNQAKMLERPHRKSKAKKSKSQTIHAPSSSHNLRSTTRANPTRRGGIMDFLDANLNNNTIGGGGGDVDEQDMTLKILNSSADLAANKKCRAHSTDRSKVQMKYLNFHRKNVKAKTNKRSSTTVRQQHHNAAGSTTQAPQHHDLRSKNEAVKSTSADKIQRRVTESLSPPRSTKTGAKVRLNNTAAIAPQQVHHHDGKKSQTKSAVDIPQGISTIRLDQPAASNNNPHNN